MIWWANAPCVIGFRSVQVEAIRTGSHPSGGWLVSAFFVVVPGRRGVARRARSARRSRHGVALGPAVCPGNGTTFALETIRVRVRNLPTPLAYAARITFFIEPSQLQAVC